MLEKAQSYTCDFSSIKRKSDYLLPKREWWALFFAHCCKIQLKREKDAVSTDTGARVKEIKTAVN